MLTKTILLRHEGQSIEFGGQKITVTRGSAKKLYGLDGEMVQLVKLFTALADAMYPDPEHLPFPEAGTLPQGQSSVFFSIAECQVTDPPCLSETVLMQLQLFSQSVKSPDSVDVVYLLFRDVAARIHDSLQAAGILPFWFAVGTNLPHKFFTLEDQPAQFNIIIPSLKNLLNLDCLVQICAKYFNCKLPERYRVQDDR